MKDGRGVERLGCCVMDCPCDQFTTTAGKLNKCANCNHYPIHHEESGKASNPPLKQEQSLLPHLHGIEVTSSDDSEDDYGVECGPDDPVDDEGKEYFSSDGEEAVDGDESPMMLSGHPQGPCSFPPTESLPGVGRSVGMPSPSIVSAGLLCSPPAPPCKLPGCSSPRYQQPPDGTVASGFYDFCSKSHARRFASLQPAQASPRVAATYPATNSREKCKVPSCLKKRYSSGSILEDFCGQKCAEIAGTKRISPATLCSVTPDSVEFRTVCEKFLGTWAKGAKPERNSVRAILYIDCSRLNKQYSQYTSGVLAGSANEVEYFHGTTLRCDLARTATPCSDTSCGACGISKSGFSVSKMGSHVARYKRLGMAFYSAPNSSKCHEYTEGFAQCRALILCKVARGKVCESKKDMLDLSSPPKGYHSVAATPGIHHEMRYAEVATYKPDSILPQYVILYQHQGEKLLL